MSASACIAFYGVRFEVRPDEIEALEDRSDPRVLAARKAGLMYYWGNFGQPGEQYLLFIGSQLGKLGPENSSEVALSSYDLRALAEATSKKLQTVGIPGDSALYIQWQPDA